MGRKCHKQEDLLVPSASSVSVLLKNPCQAWRRHAGPVEAVLGRASAL